MLDKIRKFFGSQTASSEDSIRKVVPEEPCPDAPEPVSMVFVDAVIEISPDTSIQDFFDTVEVDIDRKFAVDKNCASMNPHASGELYLSVRFWGFPDADYSDLSLLCAIPLHCRLISAIFEFQHRMVIADRELACSHPSTAEGTEVTEQEKYIRFHKGVKALGALRQQQKCEAVSVGAYRGIHRCNICGNDMWRSRNCRHWPGIVYIIEEEGSDKKREIKCVPVIEVPVIEEVAE